MKPRDILSRSRLSAICSRFSPRWSSGLRIVIDPYLPGSIPFITYFIAVAASGWVGGYGPAVLTTALCACIARYFYLSPAFSFQLATHGSRKVWVLRVRCLSMGGLTAARIPRLTRPDA